MNKRQAKMKIEVQLASGRLFAHNLIGIYLESITRRYGNAAANKLIDDCGLEAVGWRKVKKVKR